jgi:hypothetical protein
MKHIAHFMDKYEDVAETLKSILFSLLVTAAILGLAPAVMVLQAMSF